jgi:hypothetical protein
MTNRSDAFRGCVWVCVSGVSVTFQNNRLGWIDIVPDKVAVDRAASSTTASLTLYSGSGPPVIVLVFVRLLFGIIPVIGPSWYTH